MKKNNLKLDNEKLIKKFGANRISSLKHIPDFYTFKKGLIYSHRDFDKFFQALKDKKKCAIVSGFNASGTIHLGHKIVFDTNLFFQRKYNLPVFIPISDDESYVSNKIETQEKALKFSFELAKELLAYGFDPKNTYFIIDQVYTNIYNLAIKFSKKINLSEIKAVYGYKNKENIGLHFYPAIQAAHILFPKEELDIDYILVPIGPDEDAHIRICRDIAQRIGYKKPAILHTTFLPGIDGNKMSKSKNNAIFLNESKTEIIKKIKKAFSGGQKTIEEHRKKGGNPEIDISYNYLSKFFLNEKETKNLFNNYKSGKILSGEIKKILENKILKFTDQFKKNLEKISNKDLKKTILTNQTNLKKLHYLK